MRLRAPAAVIGIFVAMTSQLQAQDLSLYRWQARPLLLFAPSEQNPLLAEQLQRLETQEAFLTDRDMVVAIVYPAFVRFVHGAPQDLSAAQLRRQFGVKETAFSVILVGKDGGAKARSQQPVDVAEIYQLIDAMPMRRREMQDHEVDKASP